MSKRTTPPNAALPIDTECELMALENIVRLAAFAVEARRTLGQIDLTMENFPEVKQRIEQVVDYSGQWTCHENTTAAVLVDVADRLADIVAKG